MSWWNAHPLYECQPEHESAWSIPGWGTYLPLWIKGTMGAFVLSQSRLCRPRCSPTTKHHGAEVEISRTGLPFLFSVTPLFSIPHCCSFIAAPPLTCTNNGASLLARTADRDHREPIRAREYYMCVISQCRKCVRGNQCKWSDRLVETKTNRSTFHHVALSSRGGRGVVKD